MRKVQNILNYIFLKKRSLIEKYKVTKKTESRICLYQNIQKINDVILSTYFTTKKDPQRGEFAINNNFGYIKEFYESVIKQDLYAVIFYDSLTEDFINKYECKNVHFIRVNLGPYSLNDERFYIYSEYINLTKPSKIIMADINDVIFLKKDVFKFINKDTLYICKDESYSIYENPWIKNKINNLTFPLDKKKYSFWEMPIVNAGVIGGDFNCINVFLGHLLYLFDKLDNDLNNNMICVNIIFHDLYWLNYANNFTFKLKHIFDKKWTKKQINSKFINSSSFVVGYPFTTVFKEEEFFSNAFIKHK